MPQQLLKRLFNNRAAQAGHFICLGDISLLQRERFVLSHILGWTEITDTAIYKPECLLVGTQASAPLPVESILTQHEHDTAAFILTPVAQTATIQLSGYESHHYRLFCQCNNIYYFYLLRKTYYPVSPLHNLRTPEIKEALKKSYYTRNLPSDTAAEIMRTDARRLLVPERFDIAIKCNYGRLRKLNAGESWRKYLYYEHLLRITGKQKTIQEYDDTGKQGLNAFMDCFDSLLAPLHPESIHFIPVNRNNVAMDGSHRIAAAIVNCRPIRYIRIDAATSHLASSAFFAGIQHGHTPCPAEILDEAAIEYCRIKTGLAIALIFPTVASDVPALERLKKLGKIVHYKKVIMSPKAGGSLLRQVYLGHTWFENCADDAGFINKQKSCFPFKGTLRAVLIDEFDPSGLRQAKEDIRNMFGVGNHSIHITDSDEETLRVARVMFNQNSLDILEAGIGNLPLFHQKLARYRNWIKENNLNEELFSIDGGAILSLFGLRECRDLDFLYLGKPLEGSLPPPHGIDCHNELAQFHMYSIPEIIGDPRLHCWYMGMKFCAPIVVLQMKQARAEHKDIRDIALLKKHLPANHFPWLAWKAGRVQFALACFRVYLRQTIEYLKIPLRPIWHAIRRQLQKSRK